MYCTCTVSFLFETTEYRSIYLSFSIRIYRLKKSFQCWPKKTIFFPLFDLGSPHNNSAAHFGQSKRTNQKNGISSSALFDIIIFYPEQERFHLIGPIDASTQSLAFLSPPQPFPKLFSSLCRPSEE
jgi:hypothetical protein